MTIGECATMQDFMAGFYEISERRVMSEPRSTGRTHLVDGTTEGGVLPRSADTFILGFPPRIGLADHGGKTRLAVGFKNLFRFGFQL